MTVASTLVRIVYPVSSVVPGVSMAFNARLLRAEDLVVDLMNGAIGILNVDYTVTISPNYESAAIIPTTAILAKLGLTPAVTIYRRTKLEQPLSIPTNSRLDEKQVELAFDRSALWAQEGTEASAVAAAAAASLQNAVILAEASASSAVDSASAAAVSAASALAIAGGAYGPSTPFLPLPPYSGGGGGGSAAPDYTPVFRTLGEFRQGGDPDDTLAFERWAAQCSGTATVVNVLFLPMTTLNVVRTISLTNKNFAVIGAGKTRINLNSTNAFFSYQDTTGQDNSRVAFKDIEIQFTQANTAGGISVIKPYSGTSHNKQFSMENVTFVGGLGWAATCLYCRNVWNGVIQDSGGNMYYGDPGTPTGICFHLDGMSNAWEIRGSTAYGFATHIKMGMYDGGVGSRYPSEGLKVVGGESVGCNTGIDYVIPDNRTRPAVGLFVVNYHTNIHSTGIYCRNVYQIAISNGLHYTLQSTANDFYFVNCSLIAVTNCLFETSAAGGAPSVRAVTMITCTQFSIGMLNIRSRGEGVYADGSSSNGRIHTPVYSNLTGGGVSLPAGNGGNGIYIVA